MGLSWIEAYNMAIDGELDMLPAITKTQEREQYFLFSQPYYFYKRVIVTRDTEKDIYGIEDLENLTVAVQQNSSHHSYLLSFPKINLSLYNSVEDALTAVANGTERAYVGNLATTNYLIKSTALTNLKFSAFETEEQQAIFFAFRKEWPELEGILNKVLDTVTEEQRIAINNKWIDLDTEMDYGPVLRIAAMIGLLVAIVIGVSIYWIIRLRKEIEKRKIIQKDLELAKLEAEEANGYKSSFMARMSHEIRTPLNAITGMAYLLKKTNISLTQSMYVDRITQASINMLSIINDILDFSKIESGKVELEITSFSLDHVIQDVINIVSYKVESQEIGLKLSKDPNVPTWFYGDQKRIEQILLNILNNAAKFTSKGEVSLEIRLRAKENDKYHLSFSIKDTGIGMSQEQINKLFSPFVQGDSSINRRFGGSGLGLSIVKNLVEMMDGKVQVFSTEGEGSTFIIHLTLEVDKEKEAEYVRDISSNHFKDLRTLVLEKTGASMNLIESYLGSFGMHCELTTSQSSALGMLEAADGKFAKPFDLFILDYETPTEGGLEFLKMLHSSNKIHKMPKVIVLLPMMREDLLDRLSQHGVEMGVVKPVIPSVLLNGILDMFKLKAISASQTSKNREIGSNNLGEGYTVLVVEDNKTNQMIARTILHQAGIDSLIAGDGQAGVQEYINNKDNIDLILMDIHMPIMNGYDAAKEIRKLSSTIPIVAMTADVILGVKEKCEESGINHYISKPFNPDSFIKTIRELIINNKVVDENPILDKTIGLYNTGENMELYKMVLNEYRNENVDTLLELESHLEAKRYKDAIMIIHKVKGSSGSIGAKDLYELAVTFQKELVIENEEKVEVIGREFTKKFKKLLREIEEILKS